MWREIGSLPRKSGSRRQEALRFLQTDQRVPRPTKVDTLRMYPTTPLFLSKTNKHVAERQTLQFSSLEFGDTDNCLIYIVKSKSTSLFMAIPASSSHSGFSTSIWYELICLSSYPSRPFLTPTEEHSLFSTTFSMVSSKYEAQASRISGIYPSFLLLLSSYDRRWYLSSFQHVPVNRAKERMFFHFLRIPHSSQSRRGLLSQQLLSIPLRCPTLYSRSLASDDTVDGTSTGKFRILAYKRLRS